MAYSTCGAFSIHGACNSWILTPPTK